MYFSCVVPLLFLAFAACLPAQDTSTDVVKQAFTDSSIVPFVIPSFIPLMPLDVTFTDPDSGKALPVTAGVQLTVQQVSKRPKFALGPNNRNVTNRPYLIVMFDPDAPTPQDQSLGQIRHLVGADFTTAGADSTGNFPLANQTAALSDYIPPGPPPSSAPHRYIVLAFTQTTAGLTPPPDYRPADVTKFNVTTFAAQVPGLALVAGTYFIVGPAGAPTLPGAANSSASAGTATPSSAAGTLLVLDSWSWQAIAVVLSGALWACI